MATVRTSPVRFTGSTRYFARSARLSTPIVYMPPAGSTPQTTANRKISISANQNTGIEMPASAAKLMA